MENEPSPLNRTPFIGQASCNDRFVVIAAFMAPRLAPCKATVADAKGLSKTRLQPVFSTAQQPCGKFSPVAFWSFPRVGQMWATANLRARKTARKKVCMGKTFADFSYAISIKKGALQNKRSKNKTRGWPIKGGLSSCLV